MLELSFKNLLKENRSQAPALFIDSYKLKFFMLNLILKETSFLEEIKLIQEKENDANTFLIQ